MSSGLVQSVLLLVRKSGGYSFSDPNRLTIYAYTAEPSGIGDLPGGLPTLTRFAADSGNETQTLVTYFESGPKIGLASSVTQGNGSLDPAVTTYDYDARRNRSQVTTVLDTADGEGGNRVVNSTYDALDRLVTVTQQATSDHAAPVTQYRYDAAGNVFRMTDARGNVTDYFYDAMNRLRLTRQPMTGGATGTPQVRVGTSRVYDVAGNLLFETDEQGATTTFKYDERNLATQVTQPDPTTGLPSGTKTYFTYDTLGQLKTQSDPRNSSWVTSFGYDQRGRGNVTIQPPKQRCQEPFLAKSSPIGYVERSWDDRIELLKGALSIMYSTGPMPG